MARMKTFFLYALIVIAFMIFSDFFIFAAIKTTYVDFDRQIVATQHVKVTIQEAKKTYMNGYIKGTIENVTNQTINDKYLKYEFFSNQDNSLGAKYIRLNDLEAGEKRDFEVTYNIQDTSYYRVTEIDADEAHDVGQQLAEGDVRAREVEDLADLDIIALL